MNKLRWKQKRVYGETNYWTYVCGYKFEVQNWGDGWKITCAHTSWTMLETVESFHPHPYRTATEAKKELGLSIRHLVKRYWELAEKELKEDIA